MKFKTGELLYPNRSYGVVGRCPQREQVIRHYHHVLGETAGVFIEYTPPQNFGLHADGAPRVLMLILVEDEPMLFNKGDWRRPEAKCR